MAVAAIRHAPPRSAACSSSAAARLGQQEQPPDFGAHALRPMPGRVDLRMPRRLERQQVNQSRDGPSAAAFRTAASTAAGDVQSMSRIRAPDQGDSPASRPDPLGQALGNSSVVFGDQHGTARHQPAFQVCRSGNPPPPGAVAAAAPCGLPFLFPLIGLPLGWRGHRAGAAAAYLPCRSLARRGRQWRPASSR